MQRKTIAFLFLALLLYPATLLFSESPLTVTRVIDSDTLELSSGETVRLIGIDCDEQEYSPADAAYLNRGKKWERGPDSLKHAKEAAEFTRKLVEGKKVRLDYDVQRRDKYGRLLAYVYVLVCNNCDVLRAAEYEYLDMIDPDESNAVCIFLNATLIKAGYAQVVTVPPSVKYADLFVKLEKEARGRKRGLRSEGKI